MNAYREADDRLFAEYDRKATESLIEIIAASAGKTIAETISAKEPDDDYYANHLEAVLFTDGTGVMLDYYGGSQGYSTLTPGSDSEVTYYILTKKPGA